VSWGRLPAPDARPRRPPHDRTTAEIQVEALINGSWHRVLAITPVPYRREKIVTFEVAQADDPLYEDALKPKLEDAIAGESAFWVTVGDGETVLCEAGTSLFRIAHVYGSPPGLH